MDTTEKQTLMESLAARYTMTFLDLHTFDRWGQSSTTGIFEKDGRKFVFVPGDTVTLGWEQFAVGLNQESREELEYLFREWEMEPQNPEEMIRESIDTVFVSRDHFRIELQRIRDLDGIITVCAQEKLCVIKIIKVIDRVSRSKLDPFDLLQIQEIYFLCRRRLSTVLDTVERLFY